MTRLRRKFLTSDLSFSPQLPQQTKGNLGEHFSASACSFLGLAFEKLSLGSLLSTSVTWENSNHRSKILLPCSCFSISPTGTIPRALGMICRCLISLFDASKGPLISLCRIISVECPKNLNFLLLISNQNKGCPKQPISMKHRSNFVGHSSKIIQQRKIKRPLSGGGHVGNFITQGGKVFPPVPSTQKLQRLGHIMRNFSIDSYSSIDKKIASIF